MSIKTVILPQLLMQAAVYILLNAGLRKKDCLESASIRLAEVLRKTDHSARSAV